MRRRLGSDPLASSASGRFSPIPIDRLKVAGRLAPLILARRGSASPLFSMEAGQRLAVLVPFRDREAHLEVLLPRLSGALDRQAIDWHIYVVEQAPGKLFSRARMINAGALVAGDSCDYFCIHDVDTYPESADYRCPSQPLRLIKRFTATFRPISEIRGTYFSGAIAIRRDQFLAVNGFDNGFWGFGSQDEDFFLRCLLGGLVPHEDLEGIFGELDNPPAEQSYRRRRIRRHNKRRLIWQGWLGRIGRTGVNELGYRVAHHANEDRVTRLLIET